MKIMRFLLVVLEIVLLATPNLYYQAAFATENFAVVTAFFVLNIAFIKSLEYFFNLAKNFGKPTR